MAHLPSSQQVALRIRSGFFKYYQGERLEDDEILAMLAYLDPIVQNGWALDTRFKLFVAELHNVHTTIYGYMQQRMAHNRWAPSQQQKRKPPPLESVDKPRFLRDEVEVEKEEGAK